MSLFERERPVSFKVGARELAGVLHVARGAAEAAVLFLHGFTGTRVEPHRLFVKCARRLAEAGIPSLRFDHAGCGESEGEFEEQTLDRMLREATAAAAFLREHMGAKRIGLVGLSLGGLTAARLAARDASVAALALWAPVANFEQLMLKAAGAPSLKVLLLLCPLDYHGSAIGEGFVRSVAGVCGPAELRGWRGRALIVHGTADEDVPLSHAEEYAAALGESARLLVLEEADHTFNSILHEGRVLSETLRFLREALG